MLCHFSSETARAKVLPNLVLILLHSFMWVHVEESMILEKLESELYRLILQMWELPQFIK
ncbi:hypothetical protein LEP1GSC034_1281 [Leptospira interrogans str. 2003000735]|uniref:Uncharacterized protein n=1 Tax=Leptospira interrogans str. 2002000626 TaxID=996803 RepID=A0A829D9T4_LEPIR|nr:hypothetical protein LEP1GSC026_3937 [Leptospira interrogans str. 2002000623]EMJ69686.1 hypothetical protein LEP1GSC033_1632 [Leptospira interrogans str. 2002000632]EMJ73723.1 hypothetical protein LEP1GSC034_1281 [Leptospira interrogans str. 2003000735]EMJ78351.1 hypothetical protein LEP1GSC032_0750 [Leptospira interrogans str. 2002000631]EMY05569.1 hypothetical protein LEP1GSC029_0960 [Leptospira interrogans str. 2002000626]OOB98844.1 hypothetical protein B0192_08645 [Leptospira interrogan